MFTKTLFRLASLAVVLAMLAGCGGAAATPQAQPPATEAQPPTPTQAAPPPTATQAAQAAPPTPEEGKVLRVWITWGDNPAQIQTLFDKFGTANGVKVEVTAPVAEDKVLPALTGSEPPDILVLGGGDLVKSYKREGLVDDLSEAINVGGVDLNDIYPATMQQCKQGGKLYCLPWGSDLYALFWNKDLFEAAGLDPNRPPQTMEELVEYADKLTKVGSDGKIEQIGFVPDLSWSHTDLYVRMFGGFWYNDDGTELTANSQPMVDALLWQQQFYTKYGAENVQAFSSSFGEYMSPDHPFYVGKVAMMVEGEWQTGPNFISKYKPELNYGVVAFPPPAAAPDRAGTVVAQGTVALIPSGAKDKTWSAKLLAWMMSPEVVAEEMVANANLPTSIKSAQDPRFLENAKFKVFVDLMGSKNAKWVVTTPISMELSEALGNVEQQVLFQGADPKPLLDKVQEEFAPKLQEALK